MAAAGGALVAVAVVVLAVDRLRSGSRPAAVLLAGVLLGASMAVMAGAAGAGRVAQVAAVASSGIAAPAFAFFLVAGEGLSSLELGAALGVLLLGGLYLTGPWRGHTFHLAVLAGAGWLFALAVADVAGTAGGDLRSLSWRLSTAGVASVVVAVLYLAAGDWLDREGLAGMATPVLAVSGLSLAAGVLLLAWEGGYAAPGLLGAGGGAALALVGARRRRRGTIWGGVGMGALGALALVEAVVPARPVVVPAAVVAAAGAALVAVAPLVARRAGEGPEEERPGRAPEAPRRS